MPKAVCIACGESKPDPWSVCTRCGLDPKIAKETLIKSIYLSMGRFAGDQVPPDAEQQLLNYQKILKSGGQIQYDQLALQKIAQTKKLLDTVPISAVWKTVLRFFLPGFLVLLGLILVIILLRLFR